MAQEFATTIKVPNRIDDYTIEALYLNGKATIIEETATSTEYKVVVFHEDTTTYTAPEPKEESK